MGRNLEFLENFYEIRNNSGKAHLFYSINKTVGRIGKSVNLEKIFISKDYLVYLSERMFGDRNKLTGFFSGNNAYLRLSLVDEFVKDFGRDIVKEIQEDFSELRKFNSSIFAEVRTRLEKIMEDKEKKIELEDLSLFENYLLNWKRLENKLRNFIPEEFYEQKNNYFYTSLISYIKFFKKYEKQYKISLDFIKNN